MAYTPTVWKNGEFPPIDAEHLNKIEQGIANSAPGGFGLGSDYGKMLTSDDDLDDCINNGVYQWESSTPKKAPSAYCKMRVWTGSGWASQEIMTAYANQKDSIRRRVLNNGVWGPFEWVNPPMMVGVEYRTTEYYMGKPVYTQIKQFDNLAVEQTFYVGGNVIRYSGECQWPYDDIKDWIPGLPTRQPGGTVEGDLPNIDFSVSYNTAIRLVVNAGSGCIGKSARVQLWYTK